MLTGVIVWGHAIAALMFGALAVWTRQRDATDGALPGRWLSVALATTALWALSVAGNGEGHAATHLLAGLRTLGWLVLLFAIQRRAGAQGREAFGRTLAYGAVAAVDIAQLLLDFASVAAPDPAGAAVIRDAATVLGALAALGALLLLHGLFPATTSSATRIVLVAAGAFWLIDINSCIATYLLGGAPAELAAARGVAVAGIALLVALALSRPGDGGVQFSRTATFHTLSLLGLIAYFAITIMATSLIAALGGDHARIAQTAFVFGSTVAVLTAASSGWLRAWIKVKLVKHLFRHRYDYRAEWVRFTETLGEPKGGAPLDERLVKAIGDLIDAPAGLLLVADGDTLAVQASWCWEGDTLPGGEEAARLAAYLHATGRILELDVLRASADDPDRAAVPPAILAHPDAWVIVPLPHLGRLTGAILLARPIVARALDWEDFDLLRIAGRQVASYLAEERAQSALAESGRFDEFNRRFAFILHDVKNIVSQLSLVARNAPRHADNPDFRADMVATLNESAMRMTDLLARLSEREPPRGEALRAVALATIAAQSAARFRARGAVLVDGDTARYAAADPARLQQVLDHLVHNALDAGGADPVRIVLGTTGDRATIDVVDTGCGMTQQFIRDDLFRPFVSSKPTGFGIGAFEARQLALAMGGQIDVDSRPGRGTRFRVTLAGAHPTLEQAA
ncbi:PEP-CTERM system histidine kinase PrsK [Sphingomonas sp. 2R-10]|uniref:XrtA/PEP-CTERM system histidine kinase PrsK n=1 Tax=Sphingomonas sp. 2R-10 TaxID=3045148 RepID=UPI000F77CFA9|nr:XrtA/PEP-CTERM system histidine kinase PrsK [Sphingomonas sp. 2R-10]MDJ0278292.1 PEP-CTERM system histidine kinase PrsK [Sphingomonas sp. 2R-10]